MRNPAMDTIPAFDLMEFNGADLRPLPLVARKQKLGALLRRHDHPCVRYSEPFKDGEMPRPVGVESRARAGPAPRCRHRVCGLFP
jgi:hypothetical protein